MASRGGLDVPNIDPDTRVDIRIVRVVHQV